MLYFNLNERTDEYVRPLIQDTITLDELDDAARQKKLRVDSSVALPKVFVRKSRSSSESFCKKIWRFGFATNETRPKILSKSREGPFRARA